MERSSAPEATQHRGGTNSMGGGVGGGGRVGRGNVPLVGVVPSHPTPVRASEILIPGKGKGWHPRSPDPSQRGKIFSQLHQRATFFFLFQPSNNVQKISRKRRKWESPKYK